MGNNPSIKKGERHPVEGLTWKDAMEFCEALNNKYGRILPKGYVFSLPTEAQWEYSSRAGSKDKYYYVKKQLPRIDDIAWTASNTHGSHENVGLKAPNNWGLYDTVGNVWEWCLDVFEDNYASNPETLLSNQGYIINCVKDRVARGAGWKRSTSSARIALRSKRSYTETWWDVGFRLAVIPQNYNNEPLSKNSEQAQLKDSSGKK